MLIFFGSWHVNYFKHIYAVSEVTVKKKKKKSVRRHVNTKTLYCRALSTCELFIPYVGPNTTYICHT